MATSKVAPPHISREKQLARASAVASEHLRNSLVRMRVARSDWCASRQVVSVSRRPLCSRTALA